MTKKTHSKSKPTIKSKRPAGAKLSAPKGKPGGKPRGNPKPKSAAKAKPARSNPGKPAPRAARPAPRGGGAPDAGIGRDEVRPLGPLLPVEPRAEDPRIKALALRAWEAALDKKCVEPVLLDVRALASYADYILICSGRSDRQVAAIAEGVRESMAQAGSRPLSAEGLKEGQWSLIDFGDVIVHVFYHPVREFYDLEGLWSDAPRVPLEVPPEARAQYHDSYAP